MTVKLSAIECAEVFDFLNPPVNETEMMYRLHFYPTHLFFHFMFLYVMCLARLAIPFELDQYSTTVDLIGVSYDY